MSKRLSYKLRFIAATPARLWLQRLIWAFLPLSPAGYVNRLDCWDCWSSLLVADPITARQRREAVRDSLHPLGKAPR